VFWGLVAVRWFPVCLKNKLADFLGFIVDSVPEISLKPTHQIIVRLGMILAVAFLAFLNFSPIAHGQTVFISIPSLHVSAGERVTGFEIHVTSERNAALPCVPIGWDVPVDDNPSWNTVLRASVKVGAAALSPSYFANFLVAEKEKSLGIPFDIRGEILVTKDFRAERRIKIGLKDLTLNEIAKSATQKPTG
jgi:hypothetical protein